MTSVPDESIDKERSEANALRRYVAARAAARIHPEYAIAELRDGMVLWLGCTERDANLSGRKSRRLRLSGPWCSYLGKDTRIQADHALSAYFELAVSDGHGEGGCNWNKLLKEVSRNRTKALRSWRRKGREILERQQLRKFSRVPIPLAMARVASKYRRRGAGTNPLKHEEAGKR